MLSPLHIINPVLACFILKIPFTPTSLFCFAFRSAILCNCDNLSFCGVALSFSAGVGDLFITESLNCKLGILNLADKGVCSHGRYDKRCYRVAL